MSKFLEPYTELGRELEDAYRRAQYAESAFSDLAVEYVSHAGLHEHFNFEDLARWVISARDIPLQEDIEGKFGNPPVTLWNGRRFFVSVLVWTSSSTSIHQHAFTGAFQVLQGSSVHARHQFGASHEVSEDLRIGALQCSSIEYLTKGMTRPIPSSTEGIHSLFHLERPSVSLVVRTHADLRYPIQFDYYPPGLAIWDQRQDPALKRARQMARTVARLDKAGAKAVLSGVIPALTSGDVFWLLEDALREGNLDFSLQLLAGCRAQLPPAVADAFEAALREEERRANLYRRRESVHEAGLRYFLAILLNAGRRQEALELARAYRPEIAAEESIVTWLTELAGVKVKLQAGGVPWEPNILGLPEPDAESLSALRVFLSCGHSGSTINLKFYEAVRMHPAFGPLFRG